jgi:hypothetical protein
MSEIQAEPVPVKQKMFAYARTLTPELRPSMVPPDIDLAWRITPAMVDILCEHLDGPVFISTANAVRMRQIQALVRRGLLSAKLKNIRYAAPGARPRLTILTTFGRQYLSAALARMADELSLDKCGNCR